MKIRSEVELYSTLLQKGAVPMRSIDRGELGDSITAAYDAGWLDVMRNRIILRNEAKNEVRDALRMMLGEDDVG